MSKRRVMQLGAAMVGCVWAAVQALAGLPFDALVTATLSVLLQVESYRKDEA